VAVEGQGSKDAACSASATRDLHVSYALLLIMIALTPLHTRMGQSCSDIRREANMVIASPSRNHT
jgi:hypothetical protein